MEIEVIKQRSGGCVCVSVCVNSQLAQNMSVFVHSVSGWGTKATVEKCLTRCLHISFFAVFLSTKIKGGGETERKKRAANL